VRLAIALALLASCIASHRAEAANTRPPRNDDELRFWLENMLWHHRFTPEEASAATGLSVVQIDEARKRLGIGSRPSTLDSRPGVVRMLPYPGGRHPRIGFLDGAVDPQRETKISVFTPWDPTSYVVVDVPEAIWSQHGLLYLAHTHVPTIWTKQNVTIEPLEWKRTNSGGTRLGGASSIEPVLAIERVLPNGVAFGARAEPLTNAVRMELWLKNGSKETLRDLRVQNCVMLKGAAGFNQQTNANKIFQPPFVAVGSPDRTRWIITAWEPLHRAWANPPVPCLHSDPKFPDCAPGETQRVRGWLWFYEGTGITNELARVSTAP
jgi:hypothetical protein